MANPLTLTRKQAECLELLRKGNKGLCPTYQELMVSLGLKSKNGVHRLITGLEERGFIIRIPGAARAIKVLEKQRPMKAHNVIKITEHTRRLAMKAASQKGVPFHEYVDTALTIMAEDDLTGVHS